VLKITIKLIMKSIIPLHIYTDLHEIASSDIKVKGEAGGVELLGDSLSDPGGPFGMYDRKILGCIPLSLFLYKSPHKQFTNGFVWNYAFNETFKFSRGSLNPLENPNLVPVHGFFKFENRAQGGATAYNYGGFLNFFRFIKGFFLSLILTNIQNEAKKLKKDMKFNPDDLAIIFAGANDLVTFGYCDKEGAERAIQGIAKTIEMLTSSGKKGEEKYGNHILAFTLPDFSRTPRFSKKSEKQRKKAHDACLSFNEGLRNLSKSYQYLDFTLCDIYQVARKENVDLSNINEKGIIITGSGSTKKVYFVDKGKLIFRDSRELTIDLNLTKAEKTLFGKEKGKLAWNQKNIAELESLVHKVCSKAKLTAEVKIFDAAAVFEKIDGNPEAYGFTSGCAVYYLSASQGEEVIINKITSGNAVIIQEINQKTELICYFVKDGKLIRETGPYRLPETVRLKLSEKDKNLLYKKLEEYPLKDSISKLAGYEDKHDLWTTHIVQISVEAYKTKFNKPILLADVYASVLLAIKKHFSNEQVIFWDDLHPSVIVHFLLETMFERFFKSNYSVKQPRVWKDDMAIHERVSPKVELPHKSAEAPDEYINLRRHSLF
jgi:phospholipase/lecithinase/hemolysin